MDDLASSPILPAWAVAPLVVITMLLLAGHVSELRRASMPESRRRIRTASGMLMLLATPLLGYLFGVATPQEPGLFVIGWTSAMAMVLLILLMGILDILNTARLHRAERARLRREVRGAAPDQHAGEA